MKNKRFSYIIMTLFIMVFGSMITAKPSYAASAEVVISSDAKEVTVGDSVFVSINIKSDTQFGNFEANLTYDDDLLEYKKGSSAITGNSGFLKISDMAVAEGDKTRKYTLEFKALEVGVCEISFSGRAVVYDFENDLEMSVSSNVLTFQVKAPETASTNANLKSLKISPSELTPAFAADIYEYNVNVGNETDQLIISALSEDEKASVSISGNDFLKEGENKIIITVLAESGDSITYTINVNREMADESNSGEPVNNPDKIQNTLEVITIDQVQYVIYSGKYQLVQPQGELSIPNGYKESSLNLGGTSITAYVPMNNETSDFILIYAKNENGEEGFYQYDREEKTLQRINPDSIQSDDETSNIEEEDTAAKNYNENLSKAAIVIAILSALCILLMIVSIRLLLKQKGRKR